MYSLHKPMPHAMSRRMLRMSERRWTVDFGEEILVRFVMVVMVTASACYMFVVVVTIPAMMPRTAATTYHFISNFHN